MFTFGCSFALLRCFNSVVITLSFVYVILGWFGCDFGLFVDCFVVCVVLIVCLLFAQLGFVVFAATWVFEFAFIDWRFGCCLLCVVLCSLCLGLLLITVYFCLFVVFVSLCYVCFFVCEVCFYLSYVGYVVCVVLFAFVFVGFNWFIVLPGICFVDGFVLFWYLLCILFGLGGLDVAFGCGSLRYV